MIKNEGKFYWYALLDSSKPGRFKYGSVVFDHEPFYIGKGKEDRYLVHVRATNWKGANAKRVINRHKHNRILKIQSAGYEVLFHVSHHMKEAEAFRFEEKMIRLIGRRDLQTGPLTNLSDGGEGSANVSQETRDKLSKIGKRKLRPEEVEERRARRHSLKTRARMSEWQIGRKHGILHRLNNSLGQKGQCQSEISNIKRSQTLKGRTKSPEHLAALTKANQDQAWLRKMHKSGHTVFI